jgi:uncharacterized protein
MARWIVALALVVSTVASAQSKADVEDVDSSGWTALMRAAEFGKIDEIRNLLDRGAKLEASNPKVYDGATAMVIALHFDEHDAAVLLLDRGASTAGKLGTDALVLAARSGYDDLVDRLLAAKVVMDGGHSLRVAAKFGRVSTIKKLVKAGAKVRDADKRDHGYTPFIVACQEGQLAAARTLLSLGANVNDVDADGTSALHWAVFGERPAEAHIYRGGHGPHDTTFTQLKDAPLVRLLIQKKAKLEALDGEGNTPLHKAAMFDAIAPAKVLLAAGASRTKKNGEGKTPYELAKERDNEVEAILRKRR